MKSLELPTSPSVASNRLAGIFFILGGLIGLGLTWAWNDSIDGLAAGFMLVASFFVLFGILALSSKGGTTLDKESGELTTWSTFAGKRTSKSQKLSEFSWVEIRQRKSTTSRNTSTTFWDVWLAGSSARHRMQSYHHEPEALGLAQKLSKFQEIPIRTITENANTETQPSEVGKPLEERLSSDRTHTPKPPPGSTIEAVLLPDSAILDIPASGTVSQVFMVCLLGLALLGFTLPHLVGMLLGDSSFGQQIFALGMIFFLGGTVLWFSIILTDALLSTSEVQVGSNEISVRSIGPFETSRQSLAFSKIQTLRQEKSLVKAIGDKEVLNISLPTEDDAVWVKSLVESIIARRP